MSAPKTRRKQFEARAGAAAFAVLERRFTRKDPVQAEEAGARIGRLIYAVSKKHRAIAARNLALAMPELSEEARLRITKGVFEHFGRVAGDFLRSTVRTDEEALASMEVIGRENGDEALALGAGILAVTAHFGNWERLAHWFSSTGGKITVVARDANDQGMNQQVQRIRAKAGIEVLSRGRSTRVLVNKLKNKEILGLLPDQNSEESYLPFFGKPCGTVLGPAKLHHLTGAPLLPAYCPRVGPGKYLLVIGKMINPGKTESAEEIMTQVNASIEGIIREYPDQWLWIHDRWKSARHKGLL